MATLYVREYSHVAMANPGLAVQAGQEPGTDQTVSFTTTTQSTAFAADTVLVRISSDAECHLVFGSNPTATTAGAQMQANVPEFFGVVGGHKVAAVAAA
jgi:hypothetical protein